MVFGMHEYRPNLQIWSFCGKGNATNPHTWILFPVNFWMLYTHPFSLLEVLPPNTLLSLLHCHVYHGVEVDMFEDESLE